MSADPYALLSFAVDSAAGARDATIYRYLADAGLDADEVAGWGRAGSLIEAMREGDAEPCAGAALGSEFVEFVAQLPPGNTPKPVVRRQMQRAPKA